MPPGAVRIAFSDPPPKAQPMQPYDVDDHYVDPVPATDVWAVYLGTRFSRREELYEGFTAPEKELIRKELRRINYLRQCLTPADRPLVVDLEKAHSLWRENASRKSKADLARIESELSRADKRRAALLSRNRAILSRVQLWQSQVYTDFQQQMSPVSYISGLEADADSVDDDPRKADYGYNGWIIAFDKGKGGVTLDHPLCHGKFPHQKIPMQKLLYENNETPLKRARDKNQLRYFHLQANNMKWVEDAISRYYGEDGSSFEGHRKSYQRRLYQHSTSKGESNTEKLLKRELWHGQERGGVDTHMPPHSRQIRPRCAIVPSPPWTTDATTPAGEPQPHPSQDIVLFMPYLHWEIEKRLHRMTNVMRETRRRTEQEYELERSAKRRGTWGSVVERAAMAARAERLNSNISDFAGDDGARRSSPWRPQSPLGTYLWLASKLYQLIDEAADWRLIGEHLYTQSPLHVRRTLEQYSCWTSEDTSGRDRQQVVYRGTRMRNDPEAIPRVVMVDQLWLWILDENTIVSAFPRRWGRNKPDPSAVHRAIRDHLATVDKSQVTSIYDLALIIIDECSKVFFDRTKPDLRPEVIDIFGTTISNISEKKMEAYSRFGRDVKRMNAEDPLQTAEEFLRKSLNIKFEWSVLMEAQNVIDQLQIMQEIFTQQITVMGDFEKALRAMAADPGRDQEMVRLAAEKALAQIGEMKLRRSELGSLEKRAVDIRGQLRELLDMKQQQSGIIEAKAAIRRADESVLQGRSIVALTVVTIFFLPLSFFATFFGMNASELNEGFMSLKTQLIYMFTFSTVIIVLSLLVAFSSWARAVLVGSFRLCYAYLAHKLRRGKPKQRNLKGASAQTLREFMIAKQHEWEMRDNDPIIGLASGSRLPLHSREDERKEKSGLFNEIAMARLWRRRRSE